MEIKYNEVNTTKGAVVSKAIVAQLDTSPKRGKKIKARKAIHEKVFDIGDSVADNSKMISLLSGLVASMYTALPAKTKSALPENDKVILEYFANDFEFSKTVMGAKVAKDGVGSVAKLLSRQYKVSDIVNP